MVIDNRGGAAGALGMGVAAKSPNDGYTLVIGDLGSLVIAPLANPDVGYNPQKDLAPISLVTSVSIVVTANPKSPDNTFADFLARAKAQPGKLTYGTGGVGGPGHLAFELLRSMTGVDILHVPFKGGAQAITGLLGEQVDIVVDGTAIAQVKAGRAEGAGRHRPAPAGAAGRAEHRRDGQRLQLHQLVGVPRARGRAGRRDQAHQRGIDGDRRDARSARELRDLGLAAQSSTPQQFGDLIRTETEKVGSIVKDAGIKFE